ncbi:MAG: AAA family ATPase, partial [Geminicoccaceae bacterium]|nr:AAA family ATPase [Geminicoccaceae bacterium]
QIVLRNLRIERFRGIRDLELLDLAPVTILTGRNGCGKTSVLEAAFLLCGLSNASLVFSLAAFRGVPAIAGVDTAFRVLLPDLGEGGTVLIEGSAGRHESQARLSLEIAGITAAVAAGPTTEPRARLVGVEFRASSPSGPLPGLVRWEPEPAGAVGSFDVGPLRVEGMPGLRTVVPENPDLLPARFVRPQPHVVMPELHALLTELVKRAETGGVLELVRLVAPGVRGIQPLVEGGQPVIYVDIGKKQLYPAQILGGGFVNLLQLAAFMCDDLSRLLLIDEIEDGLHYSVMQSLADAVITFAHERGKQFIIATHSRDIVSAFANAAANRPEQLAFFNLIRGAAQHEAVRYSADEARALLEIDSDIR